MEKRVTDRVFGPGRLTQEAVDAAGVGWCKRRSDNGPGEAGASAEDQAAPLSGWELPEEFGVLRRLLESRMGRRGKREFVQVLRLMEDFRREEVCEGVRDALRLGAVSFHAVKHLCCAGSRDDLRESVHAPPHR